ncbi:hypothetical protein cyc_05207 [Cyclospora cayetanensis]|uniref:Uncharacterized protein n=1 Tax=Cyclospora cayetanensis TaxID=88456 RepID=A0A1D3CSQ4_9EIME|nr:hypothetical protein cyc_05207 [Cyclospora cayetanensis]
MTERPSASGFRDTFARSWLRKKERLQKCDARKVTRVMAFPVAAERHVCTAGRVYTRSHQYAVLEARRLCGCTSGIRPSVEAATQAR